MAGAAFVVVVHHDDPAVAREVAQGLRTLVLGVHSAGDTQGCTLDLTEREELGSVGRAHGGAWLPPATGMARFPPAPPGA